MNKTIRKMSFEKKKYILTKVNQILTGYYHYYGITDNYKKMDNFRNRVIKIRFFWMNRRSQRKSYTWETFKEILKNNPNAPSISDPGRYANQWYEQAQTVKVTFEKSEGCEEWMEVSYDGSNYERADGTAGILVKNTGSNKLYVRVTDELGRSSQVNSVTVNIGKGTNNGSGAGSTPNSKTGGSAKTGDTMGERIIPMGILMAASLLAISGLCIKKRRKRTRG